MNRSSLQSASGQAQMRALEVAWMIATLILMPVRAITVANSGLTNVGFILAVAALPIALPQVVRAYRVKPLWIAIVSVIVLLPIPLLLSTQAGRSFDAAEAVAQCGLVVKAALLTIVVLWGRRRMSLPTIAIFGSLGLALHYATQQSTFDVNPWKFGFSVPIAVALLTMATITRVRWVHYSSIAILILVTSVYDYRSFIGLLALTGVLIAIGPHLAKGSHRVLSLTLGALIAAFLIYQLILAMALRGILGARNRQVTIEQLAVNGSLLSVGRQEWHATLALFLHVPLGFGPGVLPLSSDIDVALTGLAESGLPVDTPYIQEYMFGGYVELHSVASDLWLQFGVPGLILAVVIIWMIGGGVFRSLKEQDRHDTILVFVGVLATWDMLFSPLSTNLSVVCFALGLLVPRRAAGNATASSLADGFAPSVFFMSSDKRRATFIQPRKMGESRRLSVIDGRKPVQAHARRSLARQSRP